MKPAERDQFGVLTRAFLARLVEGETTSGSVAHTQFLIWTIALLTLPALRVPMDAWIQYMVVSMRTPEIVDLITYGHKLFFVGFTIFGVGLLTMVIWRGIFPDRRDAWIFGSLPVRTRTIVASRLAALVGVVLIVVSAFNLPTLIVYSSAAGTYYPALGVPRHALAHLVVTLTAGLTVFSLVVLVQTAVLNLFTARWAARLTLLVQIMFVVAVVQSLFTFPGAAYRGRLLATGEPQPFAAVPLWYLGLYEWIAGSTRISWIGLAGRALTVCVLSTAGALVGYALTYERLCRRALEASELEAAGGRPWPLRATPRNAVRAFAVVTLLRSRGHRLLLAIYLGCGLALVLPEILRAASGAHSGAPPVRTLAMPLILIFLGVVGTRVLFAIPQESDSNWLFRLTEQQNRNSYLAGAVDALFIIAVLPVVAVVTPLLWHGWGAQPALMHGAFCLVMGLLLAEGVALTLRKIPFTCTYLPGRGNVRKWWPVYFTAFTFYTFTMAGISRSAMTSPAVATIFFGFAVATLLGLRLLRARFASRMNGFTFEEEEEDAVVTIGLGRSTGVRV